MRFGPTVLPLAILIIVNPKYSICYTVKSIAPPRFDVFASSIVGEWVKPIQNEEDNTKKFEVEEVMRACGGAVQGIREVSMGNKKNPDDRAYHNRSNDGFVYFDCGSYTSGPVRIPKKKKKNDDDEEEEMMMASLAFPSQQKRMLLSFSPSQEMGSRFLPLYRPKVELPPDNPIEQLSGLSSLSWESQSSCRMPSPAQSWMLQRVKWEHQKTTPEDNDTRSTPALFGVYNGKQQLQQQQQQPDGNIMAWTATLPSHQMQQNTQSSSSNSDGGAFVQMGALCTLTGEAKAFLRTYNNDGDLQGVAFQHGQVVMDGS